MAIKTMLHIAFLDVESPPEKTPCSRCFEFRAHITVWWAGICPRLAEVQDYKTAMRNTRVTRAWWPGPS